MNRVDPTGENWLSDQASAVGRGLVGAGAATGRAVVGGTVAVGKAVVGTTRAAIDVVAVVPYFAYYLSYQGARGLNCLGAKLGPVGSAVSHVASLPLAAIQGVGLVGDIAIDAIKAATFGNESLGDEGRTGHINPIHSFLPDPLKGPEIYLPGIHRDGKVDFEW